MTKVYVSSVIDAPAADVWRVVRDFNALPDWTPFAVESRIEQNQRADQVGCISNFRLRDGGVIRERLLSLSDYDLSQSYAILESPMPVENYISIAVADADHRRQPHLCRMAGRVRLRAGARGGADAADRHGRFPGRPQRAEAALPPLSEPWCRSARAP